MRSVDDGCQGSTEALAVGRSVEGSQGGDAEQPVLDGTEESSHGGDADQLPAEELERPVVSVQGAASRGTAGHLLTLFLGSSASLLRGKTPMHMWLTCLRGLEQVPLEVKQGSGGSGDAGDVAVPGHRSNQDTSASCDQCQMLPWTMSSWACPAVVAAAGHPFPTLAVPAHLQGAQAWSGARLEPTGDDSSSGERLSWWCRQRARKSGCNPKFPAWQRCPCLCRGVSRAASGAVPLYLANFSKI